MPISRNTGDDDPVEDLEASGSTFKLDGVDGLEVVLPPLSGQPDELPEP